MERSRAHASKATLISTLYVIIATAILSLADIRLRPYPNQYTIYQRTNPGRRRLSKLKAYHVQLGIFATQLNPRTVPSRGPTPYW